MALFLFAPGHHEFNRAGDVIGGQLSQRDHLKLAAGAVELFDQHLDRQMIGQRGIRDDRLVLAVDLQFGRWIKIADLFEQIDQRLRVEAAEPIDLHALKILEQMFLRGLHVERLHGL